MDDPLKPWADKMGTAFFLPPDEKTIACMGAVAEWVNKQARLSQAAKTEFLSDIGDQYLIAHALAHPNPVCCVVTQEDPAPASKSGLKIPDACDGLGVKWTNLFKLFDIFPPGL
jgi:hypothetical protein